MGEKSRIRTILHDIADDTELIEVAPTALGTKRLLKCNLEPSLAGVLGIRGQFHAYLNIIDMVTVPCGIEEFIAKPQYENVLDHFLTEVVVDTEEFLLLPIGLECFLEVAGASKILTKGFFDLLGEER